MNFFVHKTRESSCPIRVYQQRGKIAVFLYVPTQKRNFNFTELYDNTLLIASLFKNVSIIWWNGQVLSQLQKEMEKLSSIKQVEFFEEILLRLQLHEDVFHFMI